MLLFELNLGDVADDNVADEPLWNATEDIASTYDSFSLWEHDIISCNPDIVKVAVLSPPPLC